MYNKIMAFLPYPDVIGPDDGQVADMEIEESECCQDDQQSLQQRKLPCPCCYCKFICDVLITVDLTRCTI